VKTRIFFSFNIEKPSWLALEKLFEDQERKSIVVAEPFSNPLFSSYCAIYLNETDQRLQRLRAVLSNEGIDWSERREYLYTKAELEAAPLLWLTVRTAERGWASPKYGTEYDLSCACPLCGTGAIQTSPLRLRPSDIPKKRAIFQILDHEKLVSLQLARALNDAGVSGLELRQAQSHKARADLPWRQLIASVELPPMAPTSKGIVRDRPCPQCGRDGYFSSQAPTEIQYRIDQVNIDSLPDAARTYEHFGYGRLSVPFETSYLARPLLLVKPNVFKVLYQQKVRGVEFVPVYITP
jgi:hypothetical protein